MQKGKVPAPSLISRPGDEYPGDAPLGVATTARRLASMSIRKKRLRWTQYFTCTRSHALAHVCSRGSECDPNRLPHPALAVLGEQDGVERHDNWEELLGAIVCSNHHTSLLLEVGEPPTVARAQLRHSDPPITARDIGHVIGNSLRDAIAKKLLKFCAERPKS